MTKLIPEAADAIASALKPKGKPTVIELMEENARLKAELKAGRAAWLREAGQADFHRDNAFDKDTQIATLTARIAELEAALKEIRDFDCPELNMGNYNDDDVCHLNNAWIEVYQIARRAIGGKQ